MDDEAKRAVFFSLISKGTLEQPRWMISDQWGRVWHEGAAAFVEDHRHGTLFADYHRAAWNLHEMLVEEYRDKPTYEFEAPFRIKVYSDQPLDEKVVAEWCHKACRMLLDAQGCGLGPLDGTFGLVVADWASLRQRPKHGGTA